MTEVPTDEGISRAGSRFQGRRHGRPLRQNRRTAIAERLPGRAITLPSAEQWLDYQRLFPEDITEIWLEIGFGAGEHLIGRALAHPTVGFIGCEPFVNGVAALLARADASLLQRTRVYADDARLLLPALPDSSIGRVFVLFADPWPKRRHHRRRFIQVETLAEITRILSPGGELLFASDDVDYVRWTLALAADTPQLTWCARRPQDWREPPEGWIPTRYQRKATARGVPCFFLRFRRALP